MEKCRGVLHRPTFFLDVTLIAPLVHIPNEISALHGGRFGSTRVECWNEWNEVLEAGNRLRSKGIPKTAGGARIQAESNEG
ncbi:hypothetical protein pipiens_012971 [Culex pipiens pipiens]|uniref:Uncharacterized protein n=1 Tax=Culex pipiens pipiens TaxID=38569 RepID=A0ABD1D073_CULPP